MHLDGHVLALMSRRRSARRLRAPWRRGRSLTRSTAKLAIRSGGAGLGCAALRADQGRDAHDIHPRLPPVGEARHAHSCIWSTGRVRRQIRRQVQHEWRVLPSRDSLPRRRPAALARRRSRCRCLRFPGQSDRKRHSTPASRRMRLPAARHPSSCERPPRLPCRRWDASRAGDCLSPTVSMNRRLELADPQPRSRRRS